eukprot:352478-Chlamydomonas_euryale.AAC.11
MDRIHTRRGAWIGYTHAGGCKRPWQPSLGSRRPCCHPPTHAVVHPHMLSSKHAWCRPPTHAVVHAHIMMSMHTCCHPRTHAAIHAHMLSSTHTGSQAPQAYAWSVLEQPLRTADAWQGTSMAWQGNSMFIYHA